MCKMYLPTQRLLKVHKRPSVRAQLGNLFVACFVFTQYARLKKSPHRYTPRDNVRSRLYHYNAAIS